MIRNGSVFNALACLSLIITTPGCLRRTHTVRRQLSISQEHFEKQDIHSALDQNTQPTITIWIHGTRLLPRPIIRSYVYVEPGLHPITALDKCYHLRELAEALINTNPARFDREHFYAFGWSGKLNAQERETAAYNFYHELKHLIETYEQKYHVTPHIRIITHSHGGNVALNLAHNKTPEDHALKIDELILLACPVQAKTKHYIRDRMFKKIYALYSSLDLLQILAPQFYYRVEMRKCKKRKQALKIPLFSSRLFSSMPNLSQIKIKMNGHAIIHTEFSSSHFTKILPVILDEIDAWHKEHPQYPFEHNTTERLLSIYTNGRDLTKKKGGILKRIGII